MPVLQEPTDPQTLSDAADHVTEARQRARQVIAGESHLGAVDDWRSALVSARDAVILIALAWSCLQGLGATASSALFLVALAASLALLIGVSRGRSAYAQVHYYAAELDRERTELRDDFEHELEELRALYAAKGFREPLLSKVVDTLAADDDRLLKVMMEEELGLSMHHMNHPFVVGSWNTLAAGAAGLALALPLLWISPQAGWIWIAGGGAVLLAILAGITAWSSGQGTVGLLSASVFMAVVTSGVGYFLAQWLGQMQRADGAS